MVLVAKDAHAYVTIPVFPSRLFRHSSIYICADRGIEGPSSCNRYPQAELAQHLDDGRGDGLISALALLWPYHDGATLFPDYMAEGAYFNRRRMFPIMHLVGISRSLLEMHPWLAMNTYVAYQKAKDICYQQLETIGICSPPCRRRLRNFRTGW